ncbi:hypothetical protein ATANTOWER_002557 [Ataeniobius toweri]|uniref:Uncharacterized protein n=1 Tax=Ataeniobius toweri TaxID=208326 RepID=A0ABU7B6G2_9TELE|nr:hypothetical protein [Ataeniobius toweri]
MAASVHATVPCRITGSYTNYKQHGRIDRFGLKQEASRATRQCKPGYSGGQPCGSYLTTKGQGPNKAFSLDQAVNNHPPTIITPPCRQNDLLTLQLRLRTRLCFHLHQLNI